MFENLCTLPLSADVFTTAIHPTKPLLTIGLASGHVQALKLPEIDNSDEEDNDSDRKRSSGQLAPHALNGKGMIETLWQTRRHKGSCRCLAFSHDGTSMYSAGTDGLIKHFSPEDGKVISKMAIPADDSGALDSPSTLYVLSPQALILGCDSGALHLIDLKDGRLPKEPTNSHTPHEDYISSVVPLPPSAESTSGFSKQWITTGGTTLAVTDWRKGVTAQSDDQEDELMCAVFIPGIGPKKNRKNGMVAVGSSTGVVTLWDRGSWDDQQERIIVDNARGGGESIDAIALVPEDLDLGKKLIVSVGDGTLRVVDAVKRTIDNAPGSIMRHDDAEAAISIVFTADNRMISAGGRTIKVWQELSELQGDGGGDDEDDEEDSDADSDAEAANGGKKRGAGSDDDDDDDDDDSDDSDDSDEPKQKRGKKRKLNKPKAQPEFSFPGLE